MESMDVYLERIAAGNAFQISLAGMAIVFTSLLFISVFIASLPHVLKLCGMLKEDEESGAVAKSTVPEDQVIAAIGAVMRHRLQGGK